MVCCISLGFCFDLSPVAFWDFSLCLCLWSWSGIDEMSKSQE